MAADDPYYRQVFSAPLEDVVRAKALAARAGMSFSAWLREAMFEKAKRDQGERPQAAEANRPRPAGSVPAVPVRAMESAGVGRLGEVSSAEFERERARMLAVRTGRCTADTARGSRCKLCGEIHR